MNFLKAKMTNMISSICKNPKLRMAMVPLHIHFNNHKGTCKPCKPSNKFKPAIYLVLEESEMANAQDLSCHLSWGKHTKIGDGMIV